MMNTIKTILLKAVAPILALVPPEAGGRVPSAAAVGVHYPSADRRYPADPDPHQGVSRPGHRHPEPLRLQPRRPATSLSCAVSSLTPGPPASRQGYSEVYR